MLWSTICKVVVVVGFLPSQSSIHKCQACCKKRGHVARKVEAPVVSDSVFALSNATRVNLCTTEPSEARSKVWTPAVSRENADTSITPKGGGKEKALSVMRRNAPYEEEAFFHLFCVFSKTNRGQNYAATLIACCLLQLNFKLRGSLCPLLWSFQSLPARPLPSKPCSKNQIAWTFIGYISVKQTPPPPKKRTNSLLWMQFKLKRKQASLWLVVFLLNIRWRHSTC